MSGGTLEGVWDEGRATGHGFTLTYDSSGDVDVRLEGKWVDGDMRAARATVTVDNERGARPGVFRFDPSSATSIASQPLVPDPYEQVTVYVAPSPLCGGDRGGGVGLAGEGLFAKRRLIKGEVCAFYNGVRLTHAQVDGRSWDDNANTMSLTPLDSDIVVDVPTPYDEETHYRASLGHKANHAADNNAKYAPCVHPRFGVIKAVVAERTIEAGEEVTVDYGYTDDMPEWFTSDLWGLTTKAYTARKSSRS